MSDGLRSQSGDSSSISGLVDRVIDKHLLKQNSCGYVKDGAACVHSEKRHKGPKSVYHRNETSRWRTFSVESLRLCAVKLRPNMSGRCVLAAVT